MRELAAALLVFLQREQKSEAFSHAGLWRLGDDVVLDWSTQTRVLIVALRPTEMLPTTISTSEREQATTFGQISLGSTTPREDPLARTTIDGVREASLGTRDQVLQHPK